MDLELLERLIRLNFALSRKDVPVRPDVNATIGGKRPSAGEQLLGMAFGGAKGVKEAGLELSGFRSGQRAARALQENKPVSAAVETALALVPFGVPTKGTKALAAKLASELAEKGGASIRVGTHELLGAGTKGFAVGLGKNSKELVMKNPSVADIEKFIKANKSLFEGKNVVLGIWVDGKGVAHIEPSELVRSRRKAIALGKERNQQAVWDFDSMSEIRTMEDKPNVNVSGTPGVMADTAVGRAVKSARQLVREAYAGSPQDRMAFLKTLRGHPLEPDLRREIAEINRAPTRLIETEQIPNAAIVGGNPNEPATRYVFETAPAGEDPVRVEMIGSKRGDDFRVHWVGGDMVSAFNARVPAAGQVGPRGMREIGRQIRDMTGAKTISGERISGAKPGKGGVEGGREAQRALTDSVYSRVLDAAFGPQGGKSAVARRKALAEERKSAAVISGDPRKAWEAAVGGKPLFDYRSLGRDVDPVPQKPVERNLPVSPAGFATYAETAERAAQALREPENMARLDLGLRAGGDKWYYLDPIRRDFIEQYGEEKGQKLFEDFAKTLGAGSPASDWGKNVERSLWAWPQIRAGANMLETPLPPGMGSLTQKVFQRGFQNVVEGKPITSEPYKVMGFSENLMGNFEPLAADRHVLRQTRSEGAGTGVGYAAVEDAMQDFAREQAGRLDLPMGRSPTGPVQAATWIGDALAGRVQSNPFPALLDIEMAIRKMAQQSGLSPQEVYRRYIIQGSPLR